jgi:small subunit ribosomal protein S17
MADEEQNQNEEQTPAAAEDAVAEEATSAPSEDDAAAAVEEAPAEEAADAPAEEAPAEEAPAAEAEPAEQLSPKERRRRARSAHSGEARSERSAEERASERAEARRRKAATRRRWRERDRAKRRAAPSSEPPAPVERARARPRVRQGVVVSDKADKTITVRIDIVRQHRTYGKVVRTTSTLHAHDEANDAHTGDTVRVVESRPMSRTKRWRLVEVLERAR